jgi:hypothetical protein
MGKAILLFIGTGGAIQIFAGYTHHLLDCLDLETYTCASCSNETFPSFEAALKLFQRLMYVSFLSVVFFIGSDISIRDRDFRERQSGVSPLRRIRQNAILHSPGLKVVSDAIWFIPTLGWTRVVRKRGRLHGRIPSTVIYSKNQRKPQQHATGSILAVLYIVLWLHRINKNL